MTLRCSARRAMVVSLASALVVASCSSGASKTQSPAPTQRVAPRPNIVFILTDDLSWNLVNEKIAPHIVQLEHQGETFNHYFVADSLCCPSRSTIFTGLYPHDTHVVANVPPDGGYQKFQSENLAPRTFAVALQADGYATSMLGKYLNGYGNAGGKRNPTSGGNQWPIPPGWTDWHVSNNTGYREFNFTQNDNGTINTYNGSDNYGVDVINREAQSFIKENATKPFIVEAATYAPHAPYTPAVRNQNDFPGLTEPRDPSFNAQNVDPPAWLGRREALAPSKVATLDAIYRKRAQAVESVDKLLADTEATLAAEHLSDRTYIFFSSDNGYHLGQHRLEKGKQTAFDTDIHVPLIVAGPGVPAGRVVPQVAENADLYPTFVQLAGAAPANVVDGHSLVPLLHASTNAPAWRTAALVEHEQSAKSPTDPDFEGDSPTTYEAIRVSSRQLPEFNGPVEAVYVEYDDPQHETEYYDITSDPYETRNIANALTSAQRDELHKILTSLENCHTATSCWTAGRPT